MLFELCSSVTFEWDASEVGYERLSFLALNGYSHTSSTSSIRPYRRCTISRRHGGNTDSVFGGERLEQRDFHSPAQAIEVTDIGR